MKFFIMIFSVFYSANVSAHEGHGNDISHALLHLVETNVGILFVSTIFVVLLAGLVQLMKRSRRK